MSSSIPLTPMLSPLTSPASSNGGRNDIPLVEIFQSRDEKVQHVADMINALTTRYQLKRINEGRTGMVRWGEKVLERLLRNDIVCMGCQRRKRIGLVFCWVCWDKGCNVENDSNEKYFRAPCKYAGLSLSAWLGIYSEHSLEDERRQRWNHNLENLVVPEEFAEDPLYDPVSAPVTVILTNNNVKKPLRPQIRFAHSNVCAPQRISPSKQLSLTINKKDMIPRKNFTESLKQLSKPLSLNTSQQEHANLLTRQRLWTTIIPMIARTRFLKEHTPSIKRNEYLVFKSLMRIKMATKAKVFGKLLHIVETNKFKRAQEVQASRMARRIFFRKQSMAFHQWYEHATKQRRGKKFIKERLIGIKMVLYNIWKEKWLVGHRAREREEKARAFIKRYQLQACVKCLYCLREHASLQIRLRAFINKWKLQPAAKCIEPWRDLVYRNKRVRAFIKRLLGKLEAYCFEVWHMNVREALDDRKYKLKTALYRFRKQKVNAAFNTFVLFRDISLASKDLQRVYRGFKGRLYSKQRKAIELEKDTLRAAKENLFVEQMTNKVDTLLLPLNEHKVKKLYKKCTKTISDRYKVEKAEPLSSADPKRRFTAIFEMAYDKLDFMNDNYLLAKDLDKFWFSVRNVPPNPIVTQELNLILIKYLKAFEAEAEKMRLIEEEKMKREAMLREKKKKGAIFEKKRRQMEEEQRKKKEAEETEKKNNEGKDVEEDDEEKKKEEEQEEQKKEEDAKKEKQEEDIQQIIGLGLCNREEAEKIYNENGKKLDNAIKILKSRSEEMEVKNTEGNDENQEKQKTVANIKLDEDEGEKDLTINKEHLEFLLSPEWNDYKIPKDVLMNVARDENFHKAVRAKFIERKVYLWKAKFTDRPIYMQLVRGINYYYKKKSKALNRELFRYQYDIKPRVICKRCRMGFRFGSQLVRHLQPPPPPLDSEEGVKNEAKHNIISPRSSIGSPRSSISGFGDIIEPECEVYIPPEQLVGTKFLKDIVEHIKTDVASIPQLNEEVMGYPQIRYVKGVEMLQLFVGENALKDEDCHDNIPLKDIVRVVKVEPFTNIFHHFPRMKLTIKSVVKFRARNGMKKKVVKSYKIVFYPNENEYQIWSRQLKSIARTNSTRRRKRRQDRIDRKEKRRLEARAQRDAEKIRRKNMLEEAIAETKRKNKEKATWLKQKRLEARERKRLHEIQLGIEENEKQIALQEALEMEHLVDQAEHFLEELKEAQEAVSKAQYLTKYSDLDSEDQSHSDKTSSDGEEFWGDQHDKDKPNSMYFMNGKQ